MLVSNESMILAGLLRDEQYFRKVTPFLKSEYFENESNRALYNIIKNYTAKYKEQPNRTVLEKTINHGLANKGTQLVEDALEKLNHVLEIDIPKSYQYMVDETEEYCKQRSLYLAISKAITIYEAEDKKEGEINCIPELMKNALAVSFDNHVGHDYDNGEEERWDHYTKAENKIPFEMDYMNKITNNGVTRKTLNIFAAGVNVGKTMLLVYMAAMYKRMGYNVLYVTNEINEMELAQRIDASILNIETDMILSLGKEKYINKFEKLRETTYGKLFVKEFPTGTCTANGIRNVLRELELKKKFKPDIIINDYLTINGADGVTYNGNTGTYFEKVAEELRALAMEEDLVIWTAAQFTKEGVDSSDPDLTDIGSSLGISKVADLIWAVIRDERLDELGQLSMKQLKTRYHRQRHQRWNVGVNIGTQRIFEMGDVRAEDPSELPEPEIKFENSKPNQSAPVGKRKLIV